MVTELTIDEIRSGQLEILKQVATFCNDNDLVYFLCGGSLIGAVRHSGYIPWDDDIDVMMPRPDYERFVKKFKINGLSLYNIETEPTYTLPFVKVGSNATVIEGKNYLKHLNIGINIDIFPIDGFPKKSDLQLKKIKRLRAYINLLKTKNLQVEKKWNLWKKTIFLLFRPFSAILSNRFLIKKINNIAKQEAFIDSDYAGIAIWGYGRKEICKRTWFEGHKSITFEDDSFHAPIGTEQYLETVYGDFMKLPPEAERISNHWFKVYWKK